MATSAPLSKQESDILIRNSNFDERQKSEINSGPSKSDNGDVEKEFYEDELLKTSRENVFQSYNTALDNIRKIYSGKNTNKQWKTDILKNLGDVLEVSRTIKYMYKTAYDVALKYQREIGKTMCTTKTTTVIMNVVIVCWRACDNSKDDPDVINTMDVMTSAIAVLLSFSDNNRDVSTDIGNKKKFVEILQKIINSPKWDREDNIAKTGHKDIVRNALGIIYNVSQVYQMVSNLRKYDIMATIYHYLESDDKEKSLITLATLANIMDEKQSERLKDKHDVIEHLLKTLQKTLESDNHKYNGWSAKECGLCIRHLAINDANKKYLVEMGCLHQLVNLAKSKTVEEQRDAVTAIWLLSFDKDNQAKIVENTELQIIELLVQCDNSSRDAEVKRAAYSALSLLSEQLQNHEKYKHIAILYAKQNIPEATGKERSEEQVVKKKKGHILISYNSRHKKKLIQISDRLKTIGLPVSMTLKDMVDYNFQEAVENASVVLVCFSRDYKVSPYCRDEAEYALKKRKEIIPLKMEANYEPDGWLARITSRTNFIDFTGKLPFENTFAQLCQRLTSSFAHMDVDVDVEPKLKIAQTSSYSALNAYVTSLREWTKTDVDNWINNHSLPREEFGKLTGRDLAGMVTMRYEAPECFYNCLRKVLRIKNFATIDMLIEALYNPRN